MAPKRRVTIQSDSEDEAPRSTQRKRQRTSAPDTETADAEPVDNLIDEEAELQFEREHEEAFMQRIQERAEDVKKHKVIGVRLIRSISRRREPQLMRVCQGVASMGIIERVEMVDFMCHSFLKFNFGPQINFIIGGYPIMLVPRGTHRGIQTPQAITEVSG
jgi:hypothetical protein